MGLFQKKPIQGSVAPLYSLGLNRTVLIVGLGNPGKEYDKTRHNVGFTAIDAFVKATELGDWMNKKDLKTELTSGMLGETRVIVIKPTTFMNLSGEAVQAVANFYKIDHSHIIAVYDELDLPFGQIRTRQGGSAAGHNGVKSMIQHLGEDFGRVRIGIANEFSDKADSADFVLGKFTKTELEQMPNLTRETTAILTEYVYGSQLSAETRNFIV
ncbi:MAG: aminoacyl-tRNA hydrolase [Candidatus Saccharibacteria bacterium]|nr:aminoacyl-tRNA hydrolase [Candidatus Saccharibacteria bacterium]